MTKDPQEEDIFNPDKFPPICYRAGANNDPQEEDIFLTLITFHLFVTGLVQTTILRRRIYSTLINFHLFVTGLVQTMILRRRIYS